ncbi:four helix bundle protein [Alkalihalobacterium bogoriense]|uniref:four helix bundle protein n=1 Tax=Alkalihalobacterium bogoriense TaxID=246272 RepID=UPI00055848BF|nr:four helix bundle protein [Alkalihalobacterium bogoriense]
MANKKSEQENMFVKDFRKLIVYQRSLTLVNRVYEMIKCFPSEERYRLESQIVRAVTSISANIAESEQLYVKKRFSFLNNAIGSANEFKCWLDIALQQNYIDSDTFNELEEKADEIIRILLKILKNLSLQKNPS